VSKEARIAELEAANARQAEVSVLHSALIAGLKAEVQMYKSALMMQAKEGTLAQPVIDYLKKEKLKCEQLYSCSLSSHAVLPRPDLSAVEPEPSPPLQPQS